MVSFINNFLKLIFVILILIDVGSFDENDHQDENQSHLEDEAKAVLPSNHESSKKDPLEDIKLTKEEKQLFQQEHWWWKATIDTMLHLLQRYIEPMIKSNPILHMMMGNLNLDEYRISVANSTYEATHHWLGYLEKFLSQLVIFIESLINPTHLWFEESTKSLRTIRGQVHFLAENL